MSGPIVSGALASVLPPAMGTLPFVAADERPGQSELTKGARPSTKCHSVRA